MTTQLNTGQITAKDLHVKQKHENEYSRLWKERKDLILQLRSLVDRIREPDHPHEFYDELEQRISSYEEQIKKVTTLLRKREWKRDAHRFIRELRSFTSESLYLKSLNIEDENRYLLKMINTLMNEITSSERIAIVDLWTDKVKFERAKQRSEEKRQKTQKQLKTRKEKNKRRLEKRAAKCRNEFPEYASLSDEEIINKVTELRKREWERDAISRLKQIEANKKKSIKAKGQKHTKYTFPKKVTEESIEYWRGKWGITKVSLEETKEVN